MKEHVDCRKHCGACCTAPSITGPIPGMPNGKPAGVPCIQLTAELQCAIFGQVDRPACCSGLQPALDMCGETREQAMIWLTELEMLTQPFSAR